MWLWLNRYCKPMFSLSLSNLILMFCGTRCNLQRQAKVSRNSFWLRRVKAVKKNTCNQLTSVHFRYSSSFSYGMPRGKLQSWFLMLLFTTVAHVMVCNFLWHFSCTSKVIFFPEKYAFSNEAFWRGSALVILSSYSPPILMMLSISIHQDKLIRKVCLTERKRRSDNCIRNPPKYLRCICEALHWITV